MSSDISIVILAAGKGSRMRSSRAKVLHKLCDFEMLYYGIKTALELSDDVSVVVAHQKDRVIESMNRYFDNITYCTQDVLNQPGTGGALRGVDVKHENILVLNGDMPLVTPDALKPFLSSKADIAMGIFELENPDGYGRVVIRDGEVERIVEQKDAGDDELLISSVNAGVYCFKKELLDKYLPKLSCDNAQGEYYLTDIISLARDDGRVVEPLLIDEEKFKGVNSKLDLCQAESMMLSSIRNAAMVGGVGMQLSETIYIGSGVKFEGECYLESGVHIGGNTLIKNSHIKAHTVIEDSEVIDSTCGPFAHLRVGTRVVESRVGNFVETKKAELVGVKAGHLSYLGDVEIDRGTNIGAGTITCNFDGKDKHKTIIGKNVFVGSDTQIISPCIIEDDVIIAAGTTLNTPKVESGTLAISRTPLKIIKGFYSKFFKAKS